MQQSTKAKASKLNILKNKSEREREREQLRPRSWNGSRGRAWVPGARPWARGVAALGLHRASAWELVRGSPVPPLWGATSVTKESKWGGGGGDGGCPGHHLRRPHAPGLHPGLSPAALKEACRPRLVCAACWTSFAKLPGPRARQMWDLMEPQPSEKICRMKNFVREFQQHRWVCSSVPHHPGPVRCRRLSLGSLHAPWRHPCCHPCSLLPTPARQLPPWASCGPGMEGEISWRVICGLSQAFNLGSSSQPLVSFAPTVDRKGTPSPQHHRTPLLVIFKALLY